MAMAYILMHGENCDLIGSYASKKAALRDVGRAVAGQGLNSRLVQSLVLVRTDVSPDQALVAAGRDLAIQARAVAQRPRRATAPTRASRRGVLAGP